MLDPNQIPQFLTDSNNPLTWILVLTLFLSSTDEFLNALTKLLRVIVLLKVIKINSNQSDDQT